MDIGIQWRVLIMDKTRRKRNRYQLTKHQLERVVTCNKTPALSFNSGSITVEDRTVDTNEYWNYLDYVIQKN
jgi:hypothetical protein